jgi:hypothetical protein
MTAKMKFNTGDKAFVMSNGKLYEGEVMYYDYYGKNFTIRYHIRWVEDGHTKEDYFLTRQLRKAYYFAIGL